MEYDELALRVREYNPEYLRGLRKYGESKEDYQNMLTESESTYDDSMDNIDAVLKPLKQAEKLMPQLKGTVKQMSSLKSGYHSLVQGNPRYGDELGYRNVILPRSGSMKNR